MGRKVLFAVVCCLTISQTFGDKNGLVATDNESAESAPRLYRNVPVGVYASAAPYASYSFHLPTFVAAPKTAASQVVPVHQSFVNHLTDSYGNKFVGTPQLSSYKLAFPQQFIPLQSKLPEHLAQPLVAASANFQFKQSNGQFFGAPYRVPSLQGPAPTPLHHFPTFGQLYGDNVKNLAPSPGSHHHSFGIQNTHQQPTNNKAVFTNTQTHDQYSHYKSEPKPSKQEESQIIVGKPKAQSIQEIPHEPHGVTKFQRLQEAPPSSHGEPKFQRIQESSHIYHNEPTSKKQEAHHSHGEVDFERLQELPRYETKFQIIQENPHSPQFQRIQEHRPSHGEVKLQRIQEAPTTAHTQHNYERLQEQPQRPVANKAQLQTSPGKQTITYINDINGEKTIVELDTRPKVPLLDLTLLEPLTFDNPLVPQVQHFLPRINQATYQKLPELNKPSVKNYQKEFVVQKSSSYDSGDGHEKPLNASKKKQKKPTQPNKYGKKNDIPKKTTVTYHETLDEAPEITYVIHNSPNYKETVKEKSVSYNKNTQSEPVHYTYGSKSEKEPVTYSYSRTSNEPSTLIYKLNPQEQAHEERSHNSAPHHDEAENEKDSSHESEDDGSSYHHHRDQYKEQPKSSEHREPVHQEKQIYHKNNEEKHEEVSHESPPQYYSEPVNFKSENIDFQPILKEYENNIRLLATPSASIKVDPHQHVQLKPTPEPLEKDREELSEPLNHHPHSSPAPHHHHSSKDHSHSSPASQDHHHPSHAAGDHHRSPHAPQEHHHSSHAPQEHHSSQAPREHHHPSHAPEEHHHTSHAPEEHHHSSQGPQEHHHSSHAPQENHHSSHANQEHHSSQAPRQHHHSSQGPREHHHSSQAPREHHHSSQGPREHHHSSHAPQEHQHSSHVPQEHHHSSHSSRDHPHPSPQPDGHYQNHHPSSHSEAYKGPAHILEKSKHIIIQEEAPNEMHMLREQMRQEIVKHEENSEEDFEKAYNDAALGFPGYKQKISDPEKDIFDPESYGIPRDHVEYNFDHAPFQQYQAEGDDFPKEARSSYKDARDKMKQNYYTDFSVSKPEGLLERYQNKAGYYKLFKEQKPDYLVAFEENDKKQSQKSAKLVLPSFEFHAPQGKAKSYYGQVQPKQQLYEYDYSKGTPRDNSAFASRPYQSYKSRTSFVEPQFQYGFEPISIPKLLDSELAAMASNDSPESEKPGMRKKIYKENWYIKKTSTSAGAPAS